MATITLLESTELQTFINIFITAESPVGQHRSSKYLYSTYESFFFLIEKSGVLGMAAHYSISNAFALF